MNRYPKYVPYRTRAERRRQRRILWHMTVFTLLGATGIWAAMHPYDEKARTMAWVMLIAAALAEMLRAIRAIGMDW